MAVDAVWLFGGRADPRESDFYQKHMLFNLLTRLSFFLSLSRAQPKLGFFKGDSTPWQRPWEQRRAGSGQDPDKSQGGAGGANGSPAHDSPSTSPALASAHAADPLASASASETPAAAQATEQGATSSNGAAAAPPPASKPSSAEPVAKPTSSAADADLPFALPPQWEAAARSVKREDVAMEVDDPAPRAETAAATNTTTTTSTST